MSLFDALEYGVGSAIYVWARPDIITVEEETDGYVITGLMLERNGQPRRNYEARVNRYDELVLRVAAEPFYCDPFAGWAVLPD